MSDPETRLWELKRAQERQWQERHTASVRAEARQYLEAKIAKDRLTARRGAGFDPRHAPRKSLRR